MKWSETLPPVDQYRSVELVPQEGVVGYLAREDRALAQLLVRPGEDLPVATPYGLAARMNDAQTPDGGVRHKAGWVNQLLGDNHIRGGLLLLAEGTPQYPLAVFKPSDMESAIADATAGHLLAIARDFGVSLQVFFGTNRSAAGNIPSPQSMLDLADFFIGDSVVVGEDLTHNEIAERSGVTYHTVLDHVRRLSALGLVDYDATPFEEVVPTFKISPYADPRISTLTGARDERRVTQVTYGGQMTYRTEIGLIVTRFQAEKRDTFTYDDLIAALERTDEDIKMGTIIDTIGQMVQEGILKRQHPAVTEGGAFSHVAITNEAKELMRRVSSMYHGLSARHTPEQHELVPPLVDETVLEEGLQYAREITDSPAAITRLMQQSRDNSTQPKIGSYDQ